MADEVRKIRVRVPSENYESIWDEGRYERNYDRLKMDYPDAIDEEATLIGYNVKSQSQQYDSDWDLDRYDNNFENLKNRVDDAVATPLYSYSPLRRKPLSTEGFARMTGNIQENKPAEEKSATENIADKVDNATANNAARPQEGNAPANNAVVPSNDNFVEPANKEVQQVVNNQESTPSKAGFQPFGGFMYGQDNGLSAKDANVNNVSTTQATKGNEPTSAAPVANVAPKQKEQAQDNSKVVNNNSSDFKPYGSGFLYDAQKDFVQPQKQEKPSAEDAQKNFETLSGSLSSLDADIAKRQSELEAQANELEAMGNSIDVTDKDAVDKYNALLDKFKEGYAEFEGTLSKRGELVSSIEGNEYYKASKQREELNSMDGEIQSLRKKRKTASGADKESISRRIKMLNEKKSALAEQLSQNPYIRLQDENAAKQIDESKEELSRVVEEYTYSDGYSVRDFKFKSIEPNSFILDKTQPGYIAYSLSQAANRFLNTAQETLRKPYKGDNVIKASWEGFKNTIASPSFWFDGVTREDNEVMTRIYKKLQENEGKGDASQILDPLEYQTFLAYNEMQFSKMTRACDISMAYKSTESVLDMLKFIAKDVVVGKMGGNAIAQAITGKTEKALLRLLINKAPANIIGKTFRALPKAGQFAMQKGVSYIATSLGAAGKALTYVTLTPDAYLQAQELSMPTVDENGKVVQNMSEGEALLKSYASTAGMMYAFSGPGKLLRAFSDTARTAGKALNTKFFDRLHSEYVRKLGMHKMSATTLAYGMSQITTPYAFFKSAVYNQMLGLDENAVTNFFDGENFAEMMLPLIPMAVHGLAKTGIGAARYQKFVEQSQERYAYEMYNASMALQDAGIDANTREKIVEAIRSSRVKIGEGESVLQSNSNDVRAIVEKLKEIAKESNSETLNGVLNGVLKLDVGNNKNAAIQKAVKIVMGINDMIAAQYRHQSVLGGYSSAVLASERDAMKKSIEQTTGKFYTQSHLDSTGKYTKDVVVEGTLHDGTKVFILDQTLESGEVLCIREGERKPIFVKPEEFAFTEEGSAIKTYGLEEYLTMRVIANEQSKAATNRPTPEGKKLLKDGREVEVSREDNGSLVLIDGEGNVSQTTEEEISGLLPDAQEPTAYGKARDEIKQLNDVLSSNTQSPLMPFDDIAEIHIKDDGSMEFSDAMPNEITVEGHLQDGRYFSFDTTVSELKRLAEEIESAPLEDTQLQEKYTKGSDVAVIENGKRIKVKVSGVDADGIEYDRPDGTIGEASWKELSEYPENRNVRKLEGKVDISEKESTTGAEKSIQEESEISTENNPIGTETDKISTENTSNVQEGVEAPSVPVLENGDVDYETLIKDNPEEYYRQAVKEFGDKDMALGDLEKRLAEKQKAFETASLNERSQLNREIKKLQEAIDKIKQEENPKDEVPAEKEIPEGETKEEGVTEQDPEADKELLKEETTASEQKGEDIPPVSNEVAPSESNITNETIDFDFDEINELKDAPYTVREGVHTYASLAYYNALLKMPKTFFVEHKEDIPTLSYNMFEAEYKNVAPHIFKKTQPYLPAVYDYMTARLNDASTKYIETINNKYASGQAKNDNDGRIVGVDSPEEMPALERISEVGNPSEKVEEEVSKENTGVFGPIYKNFKGKAKEAIAFLLKKKSGEAVGALHHKDVGDIDLVWGKEGTGNSDGFGLAKIAKYHPEVLENIQELLDGMELITKSDNRIILDSKSHKAIISKKLGKNTTPHWLLTAYEKKSASDGSSDIGSEPGKGKQNGTAPLQSTSLTSKGSEISEKTKDGENKYVYERKKWDESSDRNDVEARIAELEKIRELDVWDKYFPEAVQAREEGRKLVEKYGGKENIPSDIVKEYNDKYAGYFAKKKEFFEEHLELTDLKWKFTVADEQKSQQELEAKKKAEREALLESFSGFLKGKNAMQAQRMANTLNKEYNFGDKGTMTVAELIESLHKEGKLEIKKEEGVPEISRVRWNRMTGEEQEEWNKKRVTSYYVSNYGLGKTAYDYAEFLLKNDLKPKEGVAGEGNGNPAKEQQSNPEGSFFGKPSPVKRTLDMFKYSKPYSGIPYKFNNAVLYADGLVISTNSAILAVVESEYPAELEGTVTDKNGSPVNIKYPDYKSVLGGNYEPFQFDFNRLSEFINGTKEYLKKEGRKKSDIDNALISFKDKDGNMLSFKLSNLENFVEVARHTGGDAFLKPTKNRGSLLAAKKGRNAVVIVPASIDTPNEYFDFNSGYRIIGGKKYNNRNELVKDGGNGNVRYQKANDKNLIAVHNLSEKDITEAFELGGFPMPSIAITKADVGHTNFGEISLVFDKATINPESKKNKVYSEDAWTPSFPKIEYKINADKAGKIYGRAANIGDLPMFHPTNFHPSNYENNIEDLEGKSLIEHFRNNYGAKQFFLAEQGNAVTEYATKTVDKYDEKTIPRLEELLNTIGLEKLKQEGLDVSAETMQVVKDLVGRTMPLNDNRLKRITRQYVLNAIDYAQNGNKKQETDIAATHKLIDDRIDQTAYEKWLEDMFSGIVEKRGIRNQTDMFTPTGNRRAWESLYDDITLDNIVKAMSKAPEKGGSGIFNGSIFGAAAGEFKSIDEIRAAAQGRIKSIEPTEIEKDRQAILDRLSKVKVTEKELDAGDIFNLTDNIKDAVAQSHTPEGIHKYLKEYYPDMTMQAAQEIADIVKDIQKLSTKYFEAKPYRAVGFDEVKLAVVPEGTSQDVIDNLRQRGIEVRTYEAGNEQQRKEIVEKATSELSLRFQKSGDRAVPMSEGEVALRDALVERMRSAGISVSTDATEGQMVLDNANGDANLQAKKRALETVSLSTVRDHQTVISSADGAKVLNNLDNLLKEYLNSEQTKEKTFIGTVAAALEAKREGSKSEYATFETKNGKIVTIRLADHNAKVENFDNRDEYEGISIVVTAKPNERMQEGGKAHIVEHYYNAIKLRKADGKPLAEIVKSIKQALYSGEFKDTTGLAERQEINSENARYFKTPDGKAYGFELDGKIYIDNNIAGADTPIHEYSHLWASAFRKANPAEWKNVVELMKGTEFWEKVKKEYPDLKTDEDIADEVLAQYSGSRGAERLRQEQKKILEGEGSALSKATAIAAIEKVKQALKKFWKGIADWFNIKFTTAEEVADKVLSDLLNRVDPTKTTKAEEVRKEETAIVERAKDDGTYLKAPNGQPTKLSPRQWTQARTRAFKKWFGDWELGAKVLNIVPAIKEHGFKNFNEAKSWAKENIVRTLSNEETGGKGEIRISNNAVSKFLSESSLAKSDSKDVHLSVLKVLPEVIKESIDAEQHPDYKKGEDGKRIPENGVNENVTIHRLYSAVNVDGKDYRVKVTLKEDRTNNEAKKAYNYEATKIELLAGQTENAVTFSRNSNNSITVAKLLNGVEKSYSPGEKLLDYSKVVDENGEPKVVYHGTDAEFYQFDPSKNDPGYHGFYFSDERDVAATYTGTDMVMPVFLNIRDAYELDTEGANWSHIKEIIRADKNDVIGNYRNWKIIIDKMSHADEYKQWCYKIALKYLDEYDRLQAEKPTSALGQKIKQFKTAILLNKMRKAYTHNPTVKNTFSTRQFDKNRLLDYGSAIFYNLVDNGGRKITPKGNNPSTVYVVTSPNQIKSATENVGLFDPENPDIRYQFVGEIGVADNKAVETKEPTLFSEELGSEPAEVLTGGTSREEILKGIEDISNSFGVDIVVHEEANLEGKYKNANGWFVTSDGKVHLNMSRFKNVGQAIATAFHEIVGHKGLREMFGEDFETFIDNVYKNVEQSIREQIDKLQKDMGYKDSSLATEEYLARLAERGPLNNAEMSVWRKVKNWLVKQLRKVGFNMKLTEADLRAVLQESANFIRKKYGKKGGALENANAINHLTNLKEDAVSSHSEIPKTTKAEKEMNSASEALDVPEGDVLFSIGGNNGEVGIDRVLIDKLDKASYNPWDRLMESVVDKTQIIQKGQEIISEHTGKPLKDKENIALSIRSMSSKFNYGHEKFMKDVFEPMRKNLFALEKAIGESMGTKDEDAITSQMNKYLFLKSGLERQDAMAKREARKLLNSRIDGEISQLDKGAQDYAGQHQTLEDKRKEELDRIDNGDLTQEDYAKTSEKEYAPLRTWFETIVDPETAEVLDKLPERMSGESKQTYYARIKKYIKQPEGTLEEIKAMAKEYIDMVEKTFGQSRVAELWKSIKNATSQSIETQYKHGLLTKEKRDDILDMYDYYLPMRGFQEETAEDINEYLRKPNGQTYEQALLAAKGRISKPESPYGHIGSMFDSALYDGVKNDVFESLYRFIANRPDNGAVKLMKTWYVLDEQTGEWKVAKYPELRDDMTSDEVNFAMSQFESEMNALKEAKKATQDRTQVSMLGGTLGREFEKEANKYEHIVSGYHNGERYDIVFFGNPRMAQEINGDVDAARSTNAMIRGYEQFLRFFSRCVTSLNPEFATGTNLQRDALWAVSSQFIQYGIGSMGELMKNIAPAAQALGLSVSENAVTTQKTKKYYKEYVENGGPTGIMQLTNRKEFEKLIRDNFAKEFNYDKKIADVAVKVGNTYVNFLEGFEQIFRLASYMTAREGGKTIEASIADAKNITINFDRKGTMKPISWEEAGRIVNRYYDYYNAKKGKMSSVADSSKKMIVRALLPVISTTASIAKTLIPFTNAAISAIATQAKYATSKKTAGRFWGLAASITGISILASIIPALLLSDDDDDDKTAANDKNDKFKRNDLSMYLRTSKAVLDNPNDLGKNSMLWALPQEFIPFVGLGDAIGRVMIGQYTPEQAFKQGYTTAVENLNPIGLGDVFTNSPIIGTAISIQRNKNYQGAPISKESDFTKDKPNWTKGTDYTWEALTDLCRIVAYADGGSEYSKPKHKALDWNPANIQYAVTSTLGGVWDFGLTTFNFMTKAINGEELSVSDVPIVRRWVRSNDKSMTQGGISDNYYYWLDRAQRLSEERKKLESGMVDRDRAENLISDKDFVLTNIYKKFSPVIKKQSEIIKHLKEVGAPESEIREAYRFRDKIRQDFIDECYQATGGM